MPQGDSTKTPRRGGGLRARFAGMLRPRARLRLLPLARLADGSRVATEASVRALATATSFAGGLLLCRVLGRYKMFVDAADLSFGPHLVQDGFWEWWTTRFLARNLRRGDRVIDAGAGIGYFTLLAADLVGPDGQVLALEPNAQSAALLRRNVQLNGFAERVTVEEAALANGGSRLLRLVIPPNSPGDSHLLQQDLVASTGPRPVDARGTLLVRGRSLDELGLDAQDSGRPDFIRLDVGEALEPAWDGMQRLLAERPSLRLLLGFDARRLAEPAGFLDKVAARYPLRRLHPDGQARGCTAAELLAAGPVPLYLAQAEPA